METARVACRGPGESVVPARCQGVPVSSGLARRAPGAVVPLQRSWTSRRPRPDTRWAKGASSHDAHHTACDRDPAPLAPIAPPSPIASTVRRQPPDTSHRRGKRSIRPRETRTESHLTTLSQHMRHSLATEGKSIQPKVRWCFDQRRSGTLVRFGGFLIFCRFPATSTDNAQAFQGDRQPDRPKTPRCPKLSATCVQIRAEARKTLIRGLVMGLSICVSHRYAAWARPEPVPSGPLRRGRPTPQGTPNSPRSLVSCCMEESR